MHILRLGNDPYHPPIQFEFPKRLMSGINRSAQHVWFQKYPWLHYEEQLDKLFCYYCAKSAEVFQQQPSKAEETYISRGFKAWNRALDSFLKHQDSECHKNSVICLLTHK